MLRCLVSVPHISSHLYMRTSKNEHVWIHKWSELMNTYELIMDILSTSCNLHHRNDCFHLGKTFRQLDTAPGPSGLGGPDGMIDFNSYISGISGDHGAPKSCLYIIYIYNLYIYIYYIIYYLYIYIIYYLYWFRTPHVHSFSPQKLPCIAMLWVAARYAPFSDTAGGWAKHPKHWELIIPGKNIHILYQW